MTELETARRDLELLNGEVAYRRRALHAGQLSVETKCELREEIVLRRVKIEALHGKVRRLAGRG